MRTLSVGWDIRGLGPVADGLAEADSLADYDVVLLDPSAVSALWRPHAQLEPDGVWRLHQGRDGGLSRAMERLLSARRVELEALLQRVGGTVVFRVTAPAPPLEVVLSGGGARQVDGRSILPHVALSKEGQHLSFPQGIRFVPRRGRTLVELDDAHPLSGYLRQYTELGYEAAIASTLGVPLEKFGRVLAQDRVGDAVAWEVPIGAGRLVFVPAFPGADPREMGEALRPGLGALCEAPLPAVGPDWLARYSLPGEEGLEAQAQELAEARAQLSRQEEELATARREHDALRALLYPRGARELVQGVSAGLTRLGFACTPRPDMPRTLEARCAEGTLLVRASYAPIGQVGPEEHRTLLLTADRVGTEERRTVQGALVVSAEARLEPSRRPAQWTDAVRRGCVEHDIALVPADALFQAAASVTQDEDPVKVRRSLLESGGEWRWKR
ncbi:MAG: hypothetical protein R6U88_07570 [Candidatus Bipolaricaulota bacterium]